MTAKARRKLSAELPDRRCAKARSSTSVEQRRRHHEQALITLPHFDENVMIACGEHLDRDPPSNSHPYSGTLSEHGAREGRLHFHGWPIPRRRRNVPVIVDENRAAARHQETRDNLMRLDFGDVRRTVAS